MTSTSPVGSTGPAGGVVGSGVGDGDSVGVGEFGVSSTADVGVGSAGASGSESPVQPAMINTAVIDTVQG
jgi:hypothetical protein